MDFNERQELTQGLTKAFRSAGVQVKASPINRSILNFINGRPVFIGNNREEFIQKAYTYNADVYAIINKILGAIKQVPWVLYEVTEESKFRKYKRLPSEAKAHNLETVYRLKEESMEEVTDSGLNRILDRPNPIQGWTEFIEAIMGFKLVTGESFTHGVRLNNGNNAGEFAELWPMPSQYTEIIAGNGIEQVIEGYRLDLYEGVDLPAEDVLHIKYWNPDYSSPGSHLHGLSPIQAASRTVTRSNDASTAQVKQLQNIGAMGILSSEDNSLTEEQGERVEEKYYQKYGGPKNRGKIIVTGAKMRWQQIGLSPVDLNIIESEQWDMRKLCNVFGISSDILNDPENKTYNNASEGRKALYLDKALPELDSIKTELNRWLVPPFEQSEGRQLWLDYDLNAVPAMQEDLKEIKERVADAWWLTGNERRDAMGYDDDPEMERFFIPANLIPMDATEMMDEEEAKSILKKYELPTNGYADSQT